MNNQCVTTCDTTRRVTLTVVIDYSGEPVLVEALEIKVLGALLAQVGDLLPDMDLDERAGYIEVDTISDIQTKWDFEECPYCAARNTSECYTEYCAIRGPVRDIDHMDCDTCDVKDQCTGKRCVRADRSMSSYASGSEE